MSPSDFHVLNIRNTKGNAGEAVVDCPRRGKALPLLVCEACPECVHVSRPADVADWVVVCVANAG